MTRFQSVLVEICDRPEIYVGDRRFASVAAWLDGYSSGLTEAQGDRSKALGLTGFRDWLSQTFHEYYGIERNLTWPTYIERVYPDDEDALRALPELYGKFIAQAANAEKPYRTQ
jgi:hypothetical protein